MLSKAIQTRLNFGFKKYGHGVDIHQDMGVYTQSGMNSFLEMQCEEILDGIVYTVCSYLRMKNIQPTNSMYKHNELIQKHIEDTSLIDIPEYKQLLEKMINIYEDTVKLSHKKSMFI